MPFQALKNTPACHREPCRQQKPRADAYGVRDAQQRKTSTCQHAAFPCQIASELLGGSMKHEVCLGWVSKRPVPRFFSPAFFFSPSILRRWYTRCLAASIPTKLDEGVRALRGRQRCRASHHPEAHSAEEVERRISRQASEGKNTTKQTRNPYTVRYGCSGDCCCLGKSSRRRDTETTNNRESPRANSVCWCYTSLLLWLIPALNFWCLYTALIRLLVEISERYCCCCGIYTAGDGVWSQGSARTDKSI